MSSNKAEFGSMNSVHLLKLEVCRAIGTFIVGWSIRTISSSIPIGDKSAASLFSTTKCTS